MERFWETFCSLLFLSVRLQDLQWQVPCSCIIRVTGGTWLIWTMFKPFLTMKFMNSTFSSPLVLGKPYKRFVRTALHKEAKLGGVLVSTKEEIDGGKKQRGHLHMWNVEIFKDFSILLARGLCFWSRRTDATLRISRDIPKRHSLFWGWNNKYLVAGCMSYPYK